MADVLRARCHDYAILDQIKTCTTSVKANLLEAKSTVSTPDHYNKHMIALKETRRTAGGLELLHDTQRLADAEYAGMNRACDEIIRPLVATTRSLRDKMQRTPKRAKSSAAAPPPPDRAPRNA